jgi:hypothetical protein
LRLPFQIKKTFSTTLSKEEVLSFVKERLARRHKVLFGSSPEYSGSVSENSFIFYRIFNAQHGRANPKISGKIKSFNPTVIEVKVSPHYWRISFFLIFPLVFIPVSFLSDQMTINGVLKEPELSERIFFGLFGGGMPTIWCYFDSIRPIKSTERWLREKLSLKELD